MADTPMTADTDQPTLAVTQADREAAIHIAQKLMVAHFGPGKSSATPADWVIDAMLEFRTTHEPRPAGDLREALAWYGEQARLARLIHGEGDAGRHALAADGGKRASAALATHSPAPMADCVLIERKLDDECGCPEEMWDTPCGELHMHLSAGKASNACLDNGDEGERHIDLTTATVDEARAAIFAWAAYPAAAPKVASEGADYNGHVPNEYVPALPKGAKLFAVNCDIETWHYINHAGTWQGMPSPLRSSDTGAGLRKIIRDMLDGVAGARDAARAALATDATDGATGGGEVDPMRAAVERQSKANKLAQLMIDTWKRVDPNSGVAKHTASYVATFADMARAIVDQDATTTGADLLEQAARYRAALKLIAKGKLKQMPDGSSELIDDPDIDPMDIAIRALSARNLTEGGVGVAADPPAG